MRRIRTHHGKPVKKKKPVYSGIRKEQLKLVEVGKELKGLKMCYHINKIHPDTISGINLDGISTYGKEQVISWIHQGKIYIIKEDGRR